MAFFEATQEKNHDDAILNFVGIAVAVVAGLLVAFSFFPVFIMALLISMAVIGTGRKALLNYVSYASMAALVILLVLGTWRAILQFVPVIFKLFDLDPAIGFLEDNVNGGHSFHPTILTYVYFFVLAVILSRIVLYFYEKFQSRIVHNEKSQKQQEKDSIQYKKVAKNWKHINEKEQGRWRRKWKPGKRTDDILLGIDRLGKGAHMSYQELKQHALIQGTTGSGKTTAIYSLAETALQNHDAFIMIDGKGDPDTRQELQSLFDAYNRKLYIFHPSKGLSYNAFKNGGYTSGTERLFNAFEWSEQFYKNVTKEHTQNVIAFLDAYNLPRDLGYIAKYFDLKNIYHVLKDDIETHERTEKQKVPVQPSANQDDGDELAVEDSEPKEQEYEVKEVTVTYHEPSERSKKFMQLFFDQETISEDEIEDVLKHMDGELKKFIRGMTSQLNYIVNSEIGHLFQEGEASIDLAKVIANGDGVIFSLNAMSYKDFIKRLGRFIIDDLATVIQEQGQEQKQDVLAVFDEFGSYGNEKITDILEKSRSANFRAVISVQTLSQLKLDESDITEKVIGTCNTYFFGETNEPDNAEYEANIIGTKQDEEQTFMTKEIGPGMGRLDYKSDYGTTRSVRNYYFHPDDIKNLSQGQFIIRRKAAKDLDEEGKRSFIYSRNPQAGLEKSQQRSDAS